MHAAVVHTFDAPPRFETFPVPQPERDTEALVDVIACGLHPRVRSQASGTHYTSTDELPLVPGIDGVGRLTTGQLVYFVLPDTRMGAMAQHTVIDVRRAIELPPDTDPFLIAAGMNPGMSSWVAMHKRIPFQAGQRALVLGATGSSGQMAVQILKHLGASVVVGAGRDAQRLALLPELGADEVVSLNGDADAVSRAIGQAASDVDVVIDYLWGEPAAQAMIALVRGRTENSRELHWVQIGSVAGPTAPIPSAALRAANLQIVGSGQGSVRTQDILSVLPGLAIEIAKGTFSLQVKTEPLDRVEQIWTTSTSAQERVVIAP